MQILNFREKVSIDDFYKSWISVELNYRYEVNAVRLMLGASMGSFEIRVGNAPGMIINRSE